MISVLPSTDSPPSLILVTLYEGDNYYDPVQEWISRDDAIKLLNALAKSLGSGFTLHDQAGLGPKPKA